MEGKVDKNIIFFTLFLGACESLFELFLLRIYFLI